MHEEAENKFISIVIDDPDLMIQDSVDEIMATSLRPWVYYVPIHSSELQNIGLLDTLEEFFIFILEKFNEKHTHSLDEKFMELANHDD